jgi:hypothetical protein
MKQHHYEWGLRKTTPNKFGVKKYYRSDEKNAIFPIPTLNQIKNYKQQPLC